jgi:hypothetical protein
MDIQNITGVTKNRVISLLKKWYTYYVCVIIWNSTGEVNQWCLPVGIVGVVIYWLTFLAHQCMFKFSVISPDALGLILLVGTEPTCHVMTEYIGCLFYFIYQ